jgi:hypothetical protein
MLNTWNEKTIVEVMERFSIGLVSRVDFTSVNIAPGFSENLDDNWVSAFVHFDFPYIMKDKRYAIYASDMCNNEFWDMVEQDKPYRLQVSRHEYWICLKNRDPVTRTRMNIHQVVDNCRYLESVVMKQRHQISRLEQMVLSQDKTLRTIMANLFKTSLEENEAQDTKAPTNIVVTDMADV